jgi:hypothetical protein
MRLAPRPLLTLVLAAALAVAAPAASQQPGPADGLKAPEGKERSPPAETGPRPAAPPPPSGPVQTPAQAADQCRAACAQTYYFCLAGDSPDDCSAAWGQCRLSCNGALTGR